MVNPSPQTPQLRQRSVHFNRHERCGLVLLGCGLAGLLATASILRPDPSGLGTHRQLGLPPCTMNAFLGIRCPGCGMTTSWAYTLHGDMVMGLQCNASGVLLCLLASVMVPCSLGLALRGKSSSGFWFSRLLVSLLVAIISISMIEWVIRLALG
jgi:hypothetical protein